MMNTMTLINVKWTTFRVVYTKHNIIMIHYNISHTRTTERVHSSTFTHVSTDTQTLYKIDIRTIKCTHNSKHVKEKLASAGTFFATILVYFRSLLFSYNSYLYVTIIIFKTPIGDQTMMIFSLINTVPNDVGSV